MKDTEVLVMELCKTVLPSKILSAGEATHEGGTTAWSDLVMRTSCLVLLEL
jgi:hypothetical protein